MDTIDIAIYSFAVFASWVTILCFLALLFLILCAIFGRTHHPAMVPNKAVWG